MIEIGLVIAVVIPTGAWLKTRSWFANDYIPLVTVVMAVTYNECYQSFTVRGRFTRSWQDCFYRGNGCYWDSFRSEKFVSKGRCGAMKPQDFIDKIAPSAVADMKKTGIPASLTIAQAILESAWGESGLIKQGNNLFGIKGTGPAGVCAMPTKENYNGQWTTITANFRAYNNWGESIADHSKLILNGTRDKPTRYHGVLGVEYKTACHAIHKGGYATDPDYPGKLIGLIEKYGLAKYDEEESKVKPEVANEIISHLQGQWAFYNQMGMKDKAVRSGQLADELRIASGQARKN